MGNQEKESESLLQVDDVIKRLKTLRDKHGNIPFRVIFPGMERKVELAGIRYHYNHANTRTISAIPKIDIKGVAVELAGCNSLAYEIATIQTLFINYAQTMMKVKDLLEFIKKDKIRGISVKGQNVDLGLNVKNEFSRLYNVAKEIRDLMVSLKGFDQRIVSVVNEPILEKDYAVSFAHHIDPDLTDGEFAKMVANGAGEKTDIQRMAVYEAIIKKINAEITSRKRRINALKKRIAADPNSSEATNAKNLKNKTVSIIKTMLKRRALIMRRYATLRDKVYESIEKMNHNVEEMCDQHLESEFSIADN